MLEAYEVSAIFRLRDQVSARLTTIIDRVAKLNLQLDDTNAKFAALGRGNRIVSITNKLSAMNKQLDAVTERATAAGAALDRMRVPGGRIFIPGGGGGRGGRGGEGGGLHGYAPIGPFHARFKGTAGVVGAVGLGYGMYQNAQLNDAITRILLTAQVPIGPNLSQNAQYGKLRKIIQDVAVQTGAPIGDIESGALNTVRMMAGFDINRREEVLKRVLSFSALEHYLKPSVSTDEASTAMVGLMHMTGQYKPKQLNELSRTMMGISLVTPMNMEQIERAASYAVPVLRAGMGMQPTQVLGMLAMMQRSGLINSKSGTWARSFFEGLVPGTMGSGLFKETNQTRALQALGLVNAAGKSTILDKTGHVDVMKAITTMRSHLNQIPQVERIKELEQAFGKRGGSFASLLMTDQFKEQFPEIEKFVNSLQSENELLKQLYQGSEVQKARVAREELNVTMMNLTTAIMGPLGGSLKTLNSALKDFIKWTESHQKEAGWLGDAAGGLILGGLAKKVGVFKWIGSSMRRWGLGAAADGAGAAAGFASDLFWPAAAGIGLGYAIDKTPYIGAPFRSMGENLGGTLYDMFNPPEPPPTKQSTTIHTHVHLDGREVGWSVSKHIGDQSSGPISGHSGIDDDLFLLPANLRDNQ